MIEKAFELLKSKVKLSGEPGHTQMQTGFLSDIENCIVQNTGWKFIQRHEEWRNLEEQQTFKYGIIAGKMGLNYLNIGPDDESEYGIVMIVAAGRKEKGRILYEKITTGVLVNGGHVAWSYKNKELSEDYVAAWQKEKVPVTCLDAMLDMRNVVSQGSVDPRMVESELIYIAGPDIIRLLSEISREIYQ